MWARLVLVLMLSASSVALAAGSGAGFPQPVRVGDLIGRKLIGPSAAQPLLGHIEAVTRQPGAAPSLRVRTWSLLPWGGHVVDVPAGSVALLGESVALTGLSAVELRALPPPGSGEPAGPDAVIELGLTRPFH